VSDNPEYEKSLIHTIYWQQRIGHKKEPWDYVPMSSKIMYSQCHDYKRVIDSLIEHQVIETDDNYEAGVKCKGYRMTSRFWNTKFKREFAKRPKRERTRYSAPILKVLSHWLRQLEVDDDLGEFSLMTIADKDFWFIQDDYGRVHTNLTNLRSKYRSRLRINGKQLVSFDLVNSQPYFLGLLICLSFCSSVSDKSSLSSFFLNSLSSINHSYQLQSPHTQHCHYVQQGVDKDAIKGLFVKELGEDGEVSGLRDYLDLVCRGKLYEELGRLSDTKSRSQLKQELFRTVFFGKKMQRSFEDRFPFVSQFIRAFKKKDYRHLAQSLQRLESKIVIHQICKSIHDADPSIPILTIHDSVLTTIDCADRLEAILQTELGKLMLVPRYKKETYDQSLEDAQYVDPILLSWQETFLQINQRSKRNNCILI